MSDKINTRSLLLFYFFISIICFLLYGDIFNRMYSFIGDEYAFYYTAKNIATKGIQFKHIFSQNGVYGYHPIADSLATAASMRIFGINVIGWKMLNIIIVATVSWLLYDISLKLFKSHTAALATAILFAGNRYLFAFAHIGYNNLHALVPYVFAAWCYIRYKQTKKEWFGLLAGLASGLSLYTFFSARLAILFLMPFIIGSGTYRKLFILSLLAISTPFIATNGIKFITTPTGGQLISQHISINSVTSSLMQAFSDLTVSRHMRVHHFVYGPPISFILIISASLGFYLLAIKRQFTILSYFILTSVGIATLIIATFYTSDLPITRLHIILPALAVSGGFVFQFLPKQYIVAPILLIIFLSIEYYQFYVVMPRIQPIQKEALAMQVIEQNHGKTICMDSSDRKNFWYIFDAYQETIHQYSATGGCDLMIASFGRLSPDEFNNADENFTKHTVQDATRQTSFTYYVRK